MSEEQTGTHRSRRRRRATAPQGSPAPAAAATPEVATPEPASEAVPEPPVADAPHPEPPRPRPRRPRPDNGDRTERAMRDLVGAGPSQLGVSRALRGRDVDRPTDEDLAAAEQDVVIIRRHWKPPS